MKPVQFIKLLSGIRRADDSLGETLAEISMHVFEQYHKHGNKTPHMQLMLAVDGGVDQHGLFGSKGETLRGLSKGMAQLFAGVRKLGKQNPEADCETLAQLAVDGGMKTRAEASADAKASREARAQAKVKEETKEQPDPVTCALVFASGAAIQLTPKECAALEKTLLALRSQERGDDVIDMECNAVAEAAVLLAA